MKNIIIAMIVAILIIGQLNGQIVTDRPDQTESSSTVGGGNLQVETGFLIGYEGEAPISIRQILLPTSLFRYGLTDGIEIRLLSQYESHKFEKKEIQGISDIELGAKIELLSNENKNTEIAFLSHLIIPSGSRELTADEFGIINKISVSHGINENVGFGYNIGYDYFGFGSGDLTFSLALGVAVNDKVGIYIEPFGAINNFEDFILNFDTGFTYLASENVQLDFSFGTGIIEKMNYISVGCSWLILKDQG